MRPSSIAAATVLLALAATGARAQALQDRYDPPTQAAATANALRGSQTAMLSWTGKVEPLRGSQGASDGLRGPVPLDTSTGQAVRGANPARYSSVTPPTRIATAPPPQVQPQTRLPTSLYDSGAAPAASYPIPAGARVPTTPAQAQPIAPAQAAPAQPATGEQGAHFYSLHREYGLTPDPVPAAQPSVLELSPAVATAMAQYKDDGPPIDLAGQDQAQVAPPPRTINGGSSTSSSSTNSTTSGGQTTTTYNINRP